MQTPKGYLQFGDQEIAELYAKDNGLAVGTLDRLQC